jgi:sugar phosphate isomerase/epimerase
MKSNRRNFLTSAVLISTGSLIPKIGFSSTFKKNNLNSDSKVTIGTITYSYRSLPSHLYSIIGYCLDSGINAVELMAGNVESFLGMPRSKSKRKEWIENIPLDGFKKVREILDTAGISVYAYKPSIISDLNATDKEIDMTLKAASILGANSVTLEIRDGVQYKIDDVKKYDAHTKRLGDLGEKNNIYIGYHNHTQGKDDLWDKVLDQSQFNSINLDIGHYIARGRGNTSSSLLRFIRKNHSRISSFHVKDRQTPQNGAYNKPFGQGDTPILEIVELIEKKGYNIPLSIELEYVYSKRSNPVREVGKCVEYCKKGLEISRRL